MIPKSSILRAKVGFRECLFRVCPMLHYTAHQELKDELQRMSMGYKSASLEHLRALVQKESENNKHEFRRRRGETVRYGQCIQLRHELSQKFVTMCPREVAEIRIKLPRGISHGGSIVLLVADGAPALQGACMSDAVEVSDTVMFEFKGHGRGEWLHASSCGDPTVGEQLFGHEHRFPFGTLPCVRSRRC